MDVEVGFPEDVHGGVGVVAVAEEVEREDDAAVGGVFEGHDAVGCAAGLDGGEDV